MKFSLSSKKNTFIYSSHDADAHLGVELEQHETVIIQFGDKILVITADKDGFKIDER